MNRKNRTAKVFVLILLAYTLLTGCAVNNSPPKGVAPPEEATPQEESTQPKEPLPPQEALNKIAELLEKENLGGLSLTIYYKNPNILTPSPVSVDEVIKEGWYDEKFVVDSNQLQEHVDLLEQLSRTVLTPPKEAYTFIDTRICYKLETEEDGEILVVATWGTQLDENREYAGSCIYVNGIAVSTDYDLCRIMIPFLSDDIAKGFANIDDFDSLRE